jgi:hypothetical protein
MASKGRGRRASDIANEFSNISISLNVKVEPRYHHGKLMSLTMLLRLCPHVSHKSHALFSFLVILLQRRVSETLSLHRTFSGVQCAILDNWSCASDWSCFSCFPRQRYKWCLAASLPARSKTSEVCSGSLAMNVASEGKLARGATVLSVAFASCLRRVCMCTSRVLIVNRDWSCFEAVQP